MVHIAYHIVSDANLSARHKHIGAVKKQTVFAATVSRGGDKSSADVQIGVIHHAVSDGMGPTDGVGQALAAAKHPAKFIVAGIVGGRHQGLVDHTYPTTADQDSCPAGTLLFKTYGDCYSLPCIAIWIIRGISDRIIIESAH